MTAYDLNLIKYLERESSDDKPKISFKKKKTRTIKPIKDMQERVDKVEAIDRVDKIKTVKRELPTSSQDGIKHTKKPFDVDFINNKNKNVTWL